MQKNQNIQTGSKISAIKSKIKSVIRKAQDTFYDTTQQRKQSKKAIEMVSIKTNEKYKFPGRIQGAKVHRNATKFGLKPKRVGENTVVCPCCGLNINTYPVDLFYQTTFLPVKQGQIQYQVQIAGSVALFFTFIKMAIFYLLVIFIVNNLFNLYASYFKGTFCEQQKEKCTPSFFTLSSGFNKKDDEELMLIQQILNLISIVLSIIMFGVYNKIQYHINDAIDKTVQSQDDYAIFLQDIPILDFPDRPVQKIEFLYRKRIQEQLSNRIRQWMKDWQNFDTPKYEKNSIQYRFKEWMGSKKPSDVLIRSASICYDLTQLNRLQMLRNDLMDKYEQQIKQRDKKQKQKSEQQAYMAVEEQVIYDLEPVFQDTLDQIEYLNQAQIAISKKYSMDNSVMFNMTHFLGKAIVCFEYQHYRQFIIRESQKHSNFMVMQGQTIRISRAATPRDVFWDNMHISDSQRRQKVLISYVVMFMTLTFAFAAVLGLDILKHQEFSPDHALTQQIYKEAQQQAGQHGLSLSLLQDYVITVLITVFIICVNKALEYIIIALSKFEKHKTRTDQILSVIIKLLFAQFMNSAFIYYAISIIQNSHFLTSKGLVVNVSTFVMLSALTYICLNVLHIHMVIRRVKLWWRYRKLSHQDTVNKFQVRLNRQFQYPEFKLPKRYVYYLVQMYTSLFYSYIVPFAVPLVILVFSIHYWIDKYNLFKRASLYTSFQFFLSKSVTKLFQLSVLMFAIGNFLFSFYARNNHVSIFPFVGLLISVVYSGIVIFSTESFEKKVYGVPLKFEQFTYQSCVRSGKFQQTYWKQNPATVLVKENQIQDRDSRDFIVAKSMRETVVYQYGMKNDSVTQNIVNRVRGIQQILGI